MSNIKSAKKRIIKSEKKRKYNIACRSMLRTYIKKVNISINSGIKKNAIIAFSILQKIIDRQICKGLIHKNRASRYKSKLMLKINNIE